MTTTNTKSFQLNEEQKQLARTVHATPIVIAHGPAGTGKTFAAIEIALKMYTDKKIEKIYITRPAVSTEDYGALPGDVADKFELPYLAPVIEFFNKFGGKNPDKQYAALKAKNIIEVVPLAFMRGRTFDNAVCIFDECQNATPQQIKMFMTRIGKESRMILTGDIDQCDLNPNKFPVNGLEAALQLSNHCKHVEDIMLVKCERNPIIEDILKGWSMVKLIK